MSDAQPRWARVCSCRTGPIQERIRLHDRIIEVGAAEKKATVTIIYDEKRHSLQVNINLTILCESSIFPSSFTPLGTVGPRRPSVCAGVGRPHNGARGNASRPQRLAPLRHPLRRRTDRYSVRADVIPGARSGAVTRGARRSPPTTRPIASRPAKGRTTPPDGTHPRRSNRRALRHVRAVGHAR